MESRSSEHLVSPTKGDDYRKAFPLYPRSANTYTEGARSERKD